MKKRIAVLGAGLQGVCVALDLASRGIEVDLYDRNALPLTKASLRNEGKIHLGYLYANDPTLQTARVVMQGALTFAPLLREWIGDAIDDVPVSPAYTYVVPNDSLVSVDDIARHLHNCCELAREAEADDDVYFGMNFREPPRPLGSGNGRFNSERVAATFSTPEIAISTEVLNAHLRARLRSTGEITCVLSTNVTGVAIEESRVRVDFEAPDATVSSESYDHVVNALWDGRLAVDATAGIAPERPWLYRLRYNLRVPETPAHPGLPSISLLLGPYGDIVRYANGEAFLSWYPVGLSGVSTDLTPPTWPDLLEGEQAKELARKIVAALSEFVPSLAELAPHTLPGAEVAGGVIFAWGRTDIVDPRSELHTRSRTGPVSHGRYHSIDTGKLTTAPLFARMTVDRICGY